MKTNLLKVCELTGAALDWAVAKCEGVLAHDGVHLSDEYCDSLSANQDGGYSTDWSHGGPIIEREELSVEPQYTAGGLECWVAYGHNLRYDDHGNYIQGSDNRQYAPSPLIAAMRCYVASKLGDDVEVPEELVCQ